MNKYSKIYIKLAKTRIMQFAQYRADMFTLILASYGYNILALVFISVIFENFNNVAGWERYQMILLYGVGQLVFYLFHGIFSAIDDISDQIWNGELDMMLLKPMNPMFTMCLSKFNIIQELPATILSLGIVVYALYKLNISMLSGMFMLIIGTLIGLILFSLTKLTIGLLSFWLTDTKDISRFHWHMTDHSKFPIDIFPKSVQFGLKTILPTSLVAYMPVYFLVFGFSASLLGFYIFSYLFFIFLNLMLWKKGIKIYSSVST